MAEKQTCAAHGVIMQELDRVKDSQSQLYDLDREREKIIMAIKEDVAVLKKDSENNKQAIKDLQEDMTDVKKNVAEIPNIRNTVMSINETIKQKKWTPKDYCVLIAAVLTFISSIIVALIGIIN